jgi:hypothetical protein
VADASARIVKSFVSSIVDKPVLTRYALKQMPFLTHYPSWAAAQLETTERAAAVHAGTMYYARLAREYRQETNVNNAEMEILSALGLVSLNAQRRPLKVCDFGGAFARYFFRVCHLAEPAPGSILMARSGFAGRCRDRPGRVHASGSDLLR